MRMLSMSLSDCPSLTLNVMIQVSQFVRKTQLCHYRDVLLRKKTAVLSGIARIPSS